MTNVDINVNCVCSTIISSRHLIKHFSCSALLESSASEEKQVGNFVPEIITDEEFGTVEESLVAHEIMWRA